jgi:hypothetical protein
LHLRNLSLISEDEYRSLDGRNPVPGEFAKLQIILDTEELRAASVSPVLTAAVLDTYADRRMTTTRTLQLLRGQLTEADLPPRRAETAADYATL